MKVVSVHSHKGGSGKTSVVVSIAAELAQTEKVCIIETDIGGPGLERCLKFKHPDKYLNDYIIAEPPQPGEPDVEAEPHLMLAQYEGDDVPKGNLSAIVCSQSRPVIDETLSFLENDRIQGWARSRLWSLLQQLEKEEPKDWYLFDCSPGFDSASEATLVVNLLKAKGVPIFVSTLDRSHISGTVEYLNTFFTQILGVSESTPIILVVNRVLYEDFCSNSKAFSDKIDSDRIMNIETFSEILYRESNIHFFAISNHKGWEKRFRMGSEGEVTISIESEYQSDLNNGTISDGLREELKKKKILLSENTTTEEYGVGWRISDKDQNYIVRKGQNKLNIYSLDEEKEITEIVGLIKSYFSRRGL